MKNKKTTIGLLVVSLVITTLGWVNAQNPGGSYPYDPNGGYFSPDYFGNAPGGGGYNIVPDGHGGYYVRPNYP